jgi:cellulose synthase/poly-beta-1,6-N-acetylglucosamine synthase-like glycosyltransferase
MTMETVFWASVAFVLYVYAGYPLLLALGVRTPQVRMRRQRRADSRSLPGVSIILAARNEAARLPARIDNLLASDYPAERLEIIVASDGSTDDTAKVLARYGRRITLLMLPATGKAGALNAAVMHAHNPILVFADARQRFAPDAIRRLVAPFNDRIVGAVSGELVLDCEQPHGREQAAAAVPPPSTIGDGVGAYWKYEKWLRRHEAAVDSTVGVTGAIYAMRRWLWQPLPVDAILDDVLGPMRLVQRGYRVVFEPGARAFDGTSASAPAELRRKVRTLAGNFQLLRYSPSLLVPRRNPVWLQFVSHKIGRLFVPHALIALFVSSAYLAVTKTDLTVGIDVNSLYVAAFFGQLFFYGLAVYGAILDRRARMTPAAATEAIREAA